MISLTLNEIIGRLTRYAEILIGQQIADPDDPDRGAIVSFCPEASPAGVPPIGVASGLPEAVATSEFVVACGYVHIARRKMGIPSGCKLVACAAAAMDYLLRSQRPSGLIDLHGCNYDSSPDTGFSVQMLVPVLELGAEWRDDDAAWDELCTKIEGYVKRAVPGMIAGGFHTPNHRWVIASALALAARFVPGVETEAQRGGVAAAIDPMLAEGIDIDHEGTYIERSVGVYDAVCDRSLLFLEEFWPGAKGVGRAATANLDFDLYLLNRDGTAETGLSRRQDYGKRTVPTALASCYLYACGTTAGADRCDLYLNTARFLYARACEAGEPILVPTMNWLAYVLLKHGDKLPCTDGGIELPLKDFTRSFPVNRFWRSRKGRLAVTAFSDTTRLLHINFGEAELTGLKISQSYFGAGLFVGDKMEGDETGVRLHSDGLHVPRRPGYELPLGKPVAPEDWKKRCQERELRVVPPAASTLELSLVESAGANEASLAMRYFTTGGLDKVAVQIAFDFPPGGLWESGDSMLKPVAGQVLFLKRGTGRMRYGLDVIEIAGGAHAHAMWAMRDSESAPDHVRVLLTFLTPVDHCVQVKTYRDH